MHTTVATSVVAALFVVLSSACSTVSYSEDFDRQAPVPASGTWAWKPLTTSQQSSLAAISPFLERRVARAVERELEDRGFVLVSDASPDFLVSAYPILPDRSSRAVTSSRNRSPVRVSVGIGVGYGRPYGWDLWVYRNEDSYGSSYYYRRIAFSPVQEAAAGPSSQHPWTGGDLRWDRGWDGVTKGVED